MYKKFDESAIEHLLETGIEEFAHSGLDRANINVIAKKAEVSVGVIYKYYGDKDGFFLACVKHSLKLLDQVITEVASEEADLTKSIRILVDDLIEGARQHPNYYVMYNEITSGSCKKYAKELAREIEKTTSTLYASMIKKAQEEGNITAKGDPQLFAFFFDNLLMSLQFAFSCEYYKERMVMFCGADAAKEPEKLMDALVAFVMGALGIEVKEE